MQVKNVSGYDLDLPTLGRRVEAGRVIDVDDCVPFTCLTSGMWEPHDKAAKEAHKAYFAALEPTPEVVPEPEAAPVENGDS